MSRSDRRLKRCEIPGMVARLLLGLVPAGLLTDAIVGDRHAHVVAWVIVYGVLFGTAWWAADRLRASAIPASRWWGAALAAIVILTLVPEPADLVLAALTLAALAALAATTPQPRSSAIS